MSNIYKDYLEGEARAIAVEESTLVNTYNKLNMMYEMVCMKERQMMADAELKVFAESGTYDDYDYLVEEVNKEVSGEKKGIIQKIIEFFAGIIAKIKSWFVGDGIDKIDPNAKVKVDANLAAAADMAGGELNKIQKMINCAKSGDWTGLLKESVPVLAGGGVIIAGVAGFKAFKDRNKDKEGQTVEKTGKWFQDMKNLFQGWINKLSDLPATLTGWLKKPESNGNEDNIQKSTNIFTKILEGVKNIWGKILETFNKVFKKKNVANEDDFEPEDTPANQAKPAEKPADEGDKPAQESVKESIYGKAEEKPNADELFKEFTELVDSL